MPRRGRYVFLFVLCLAGLTAAFGQSRVGEWDAYASSRFLRDLDTAGTYIYAASSGGLVEFDRQTKTFNVYGQRDGLARLDLRCLARDRQGVLWLGTSSPFGEVYRWDMEKREILQVFDEKVWGERLTSIVAFAFRGNDVYAACQQNVDWGILHFRAEGDTYRYKDFYFNFPLNIMGLNDIAVIRDTLWLATDSGVLYAEPGKAELKSPAAWKTVAPTGKSSSVIVSDREGRLYTNLDQSIYRIRGDKAFLLNAGLYRNINSLLFGPDGVLLASTTKGNYELQADGGWRQLCTGDISKTIADENGGFWSATSGNGIGFMANGMKNFYIPNTVLDNIYTSLYVDDSGNLVGGTRSGISFFTSRGWYNISASATLTGLHDHQDADWNYWVADTLQYSLGSGGRIYTILGRGEGEYFATLYGSYISQSGGGMLRFDRDDLEHFVVYDTTDGNFAASAGRGGTADFVAVAFMARDSLDNLWIANHYAQNNQVVAVLTADDRWVHFNTSESHGYLNYFITAIDFDSKGRIWFGSEVQSGEAASNGGIAVLDYHGTLEDKSDDEWWYISTSSGLADPSVYTLAFDMDDDLWILTTAGIQRAVIARNFPSSYFYSIEDPVLTSVPFSKECRIRIDGLNNKWIGTVGSGVKVYTSSGIWLNDVEGFTTNNSGLIDNTILDIAFYDPQGIVYIATSKGISVYKSPYAVFGEKYKELKIFPQPFEIPAAQPLIIDGLLQESEVKIMTLDGTFIRHLYARNGTVIGQQAFWDGKTRQGDYVSSGVYICVAYTDEGDTAVGKIAVVRK